MMSEEGWAESRDVQKRQIKERWRALIDAGVFQPTVMPIEKSQSPRLAD